MKFSFFDVIVLTGMVQGLVTGVLLFTKRPAGPHRILGWVLLVAVLLSGKILLHTLGFWNTSFFRYFPLALDTAIQPLIYLYCLVATAPEKKPTMPGRALLHLLPAAVFMLHAVIVYACVLPHTALVQKEKLAEALFYSPVKAAEDYLSVVSFLVYLGLSLNALRRYRKWLHDAISATSYPTYSWLRNLLLLTALLAFLLFINILLDYGLGIGKSYFRHWQVFYFVLTVIVYYMGFRGLMQAQLPFVPEITGKSVKNPGRELPEEDLHRHSLSIRRLMVEEKLYLDPDLTVALLAKQLNLPVQTVSYTIGKAFGKSFRDLVNAYRVEEVKGKLKDPTLKHLSILGIALDSGFNSEASFYRVFRKHAHCSPAAYQLRD